jgi:predicted transcriptional regulator
MIAARLLRRARRRARLSQRALAAAAAVPQSTIARIELGTLSPRVGTLDRILRAAGQTLSSEPLLGIGVDRSQIREFLRLSPQQRLRRAEGEARALADFDARIRR